MLASSNALRVRAACWLAGLAALLSAAGCGGPRYSPTNPGLGRDALQAALQHWQGGGKPQELAQRQPSIVMGDEDWEAGKRLVQFTVLQGERDDGANLHIPVRLVLSDDQGAESALVVTYIVGTSPVVSIFRQ